VFQFPMLNPEHLKGCVVYYDGQHNDTRMNVLIALVRILSCLSALLVTCSSSLLHRRRQLSTAQWCPIM
jgi:glycerol-3-phosphate dehydrogenase